MFSGAVEGPSDEPVLRRIVEARGAVVHRIQVQNGKANVRRALPGYNAAARLDPWLVLVDLDQDYVCPGALVADWLPGPSQHMRFVSLFVRLKRGSSLIGNDLLDFSASTRNAVPNDPDALVDAKAAVLGTRIEIKAIRDSSGHDTST